MNKPAEQTSVPPVLYEYLIERLKKISVRYSYLNDMRALCIDAETWFLSMSS